MDIVTAIRVIFIILILSGICLGAGIAIGYMWRDEKEKD